HREGFLHGLLGQVQVAHRSGQRGHHTAPLLAKHPGHEGLGVATARFGALGRRVCHYGLTDISGCSTHGRTSIDPDRAPGIRVASSIASSMSLHSTRKNPPNCSVVSANGPSVTSVSPFRTRTVVADVVPCSSSPPLTTPRLAFSFTNESYPAMISFLVSSGSVSHR